MVPRIISVLTVLAVVLAAPLFGTAQSKAALDSASPTALTVSADYPLDRPGVLIRSSDWIPIPNETPAKVHMKHGLAPAFTYGIAPAEGVSDYEGLHSRVLIEPGRPVICICHLISLPGSPAMVRLHPRKNLRELDSGKIHVGAKAAEAEKNDLIPVDVSQPESTVWLVQPREALAEGEYALMLGIQNMSIFSFTLAAARPASLDPAGH